jgi:hypothetical protein
VNATGLVTARAAGTANIQAVVDGVSGHAPLTVTPVLVATVTVSLTASSLTPGGTTQAAATARSASGAILTGRAVAWTSTNTTVATVNATGLVTARVTGTANIQASIDGVSGQAPLTVSSAPAPSVYFNSSEAGCDGSDPNVLLCDDFERGSWYTLNCDQANAAGGIDIKTSGWCGTIYNDAGMAAGTARCGGAGFRSSCAATTGVIGGTTGNMADHALLNRQGVDEIWVRFYVKPLAGYTFGAEKMLTFNDGVPGSGGIKWGNLSWNCASNPASTGNITMGFPAPMDVCQGQNLGNEITIQSGNWYFYEVHYKLSSPGGSNGVFELWVDNCGATGTSCPATPTLRMRRTDVRNARTSTSELIKVLWFEAWSNPSSSGERYWDQIKVSKVGPIGFMK